MVRAGFAIYDETRFRDHAEWEEYIRSTLPPTLAERTILASTPLSVLVMFEKDGFTPSPALQRMLDELHTYEGIEFAMRLTKTTGRMVEEIGTFSDQRVSVPLDQSPQEVFDYLAANNPFFERWLHFDRERPKRAPSEWDAYATTELGERDWDYAIVMREVGQTLRELISGNKKMSVNTAKGLMHSHNLEGADRDLNTFAWIETMQQDGAR